MRRLEVPLTIFALYASLVGLGCASETEEDIGEDTSALSQSDLSSLRAGERLFTTASVNLRRDASTSSAVIQVLPEGTVVTSRGAAEGDFVPVAYEGTNGFLHGNYLARAQGSSSGSTGSFIDMPWDGKHADSDEWNRFTAEAIGTYGDALLSETPADISSFCPSYRSLSQANKKQFWIGLIASMSRFESNYNPAVKYTEPFADSTGNRVISRGLLQLSYESAKAYGCNVPSATSLHDPKVNLTCAVRIINKWVGQDGVITGGSSGSWRGVARYWSVLRSSHDKQSTIRSMTRGLSICQ